MSNDNNAIIQKLDEGDFNLKFSDLFEFQGLIGNGAFGLVAKGMMKLNRKVYAIKIIQKKAVDRGQYESLKKEAELLSKFDHPNIVKFVKIFETERRMFLVMELVKGGQLKDYIDEKFKKGQYFNEHEASIIIREITSGLRYIHSKDIIHRDIKPENIILSEKNNLNNLKICDFGLSVQYDAENHIKTFTDICGTKLYMAPELFIRKKYTKPVDIWSCGIILYSLLSGGKHPFYEVTDTNESYALKMQEMNWKMIDNISDLGGQFLAKLLHPDPLERYTAEQCLQHPWITRNPLDKPPTTIAGRMKIFEVEQSLSRLLKAVLFLMRLKAYQKDNSYTKLNGNNEPKADKTMRNKPHYNYPSQTPTDFKGLNHGNVDDLDSIGLNSLTVTDFDTIIEENDGVNGRYRNSRLNQNQKPSTPMPGVHITSGMKSNGSLGKDRISYTNLAKNSLLTPINMQANITKNSFKYSSSDSQSSISPIKNFQKRDSIGNILQFDFHSPLKLNLTKCHPDNNIDDKSNANEINTLKSNMNNYHANNNNNNTNNIDTIELLDHSIVANQQIDNKKTSRKKNPSLSNISLIKKSTSSNYINSANVSQERSHSPVHRRSIAYSQIMHKSSSNKKMTAELVLNTVIKPHYAFSNGTSESTSPTSTLSPTKWKNPSLKIKSNLSHFSKNKHF